MGSGVSRCSRAKPSGPGAGANSSWEERTLECGKRLEEEARALGFQARARTLQLCKLSLRCVLEVGAHWEARPQVPKGVAPQEDSSEGVTPEATRRSYGSSAYVACGKPALVELPGYQGRGRRVAASLSCE